MEDTFDKSYKFNEKRRETVLESLRQGVTRGRAAEAAGIARSTLYQHMKDDSDFAQAVKDAEECAIDKVEDALWRKAVSGHPTCMIFYLKNKRPEVFKEVSRFEGAVKQEHKVEPDPAVVAKREEILRRIMESDPRVGQSADSPTSDEEVVLGGVEE